MLPFRIIIFITIFSSNVFAKDLFIYNQNSSYVKELFKMDASFVEHDSLGSVNFDNFDNIIVALNNEKQHLEFLKEYRFDLNKIYSISNLHKKLYLYGNITFLDPLIIFSKKDIEQFRKTTLYCPIENELEFYYELLFCNQISERITQKGEIINLDNQKEYYKYAISGVITTLKYFNLLILNRDVYEKPTYEALEEMSYFRQVKVITTNADNIALDNRPFDIALNSFLVLDEIDKYKLQISPIKINITYEE